eukprot:m.199089 g.199089  ORF g.199089 m.199089 type:complete len:196 (+) comp14931_c0_seq3:1-588(+)
MQLWRRAHFDLHPKPFPTFVSSIACTMATRQDVERKWDPATQRYFYVDHRTRTTSWEDPRQQPQQFQPQQFQPQQPFQPQQQQFQPQQQQQLQRLPQVQLPQYTPIPRTAYSKLREVEQSIIAIQQEMQQHFASPSPTKKHHLELGVKLEKQAMEKIDIMSADVPPQDKPFRKHLVKHTQSLQAVLDNFPRANLV